MDIFEVFFPIQIKMFKYDENVAVLFDNEHTTKAPYNVFLMMCLSRFSNQSIVKVDRCSLLYFRDI